MRLKVLLKYALLGLNQATGSVHLSRKRDSRRGPAAVGLSIGNVAVLIAGEGHGKGSVKMSHFVIFASRVTVPLEEVKEFCTYFQPS